MYQYDAALRVIARLTQERDEARAAPRAEEKKEGVPKELVDRMVALS